MADFKLCIADPKTGKAYQKEVKDSDAQPFIGMKIGETVKGELIGLTGYELSITGGSDFCGFPMRSGILGVRKKVSLLGGVGFAGARKGMKKSKTVCGHKISNSIVQINLKVTKEGSKKLADALGVKEGEKKAEEKEAPKKEVKEEKKEDKPKEEPKKEEKTAEPKKEEKKETKKEEPKKEAPKEEPKKQEKK